MNADELNKAGIAIDFKPPNPLKWCGDWWEPVAHRPAKVGETTLDLSWLDYGGDPEVRRVVRDTEKPHWIMCRIPRATGDQLRAMGMRQRDDMPVQYKTGEFIWTDQGLSRVLDATGATRHRWVLVPVVTSKPPVELHASMAEVDEEELIAVLDGISIAAQLSKDVRDGESLVAWVKRVIGEREQARDHAAELEHIKVRYYELLYAVGRVFPGESRHETALRYIRDAEQQAERGDTKAAAPAQAGKGEGTK